MKKFKFTKIPIYCRSFIICNDKQEAIALYKKYTGQDTNYDGYFGAVTSLGKGKYIISAFNHDIDTLNHEITHLALFCLCNGDDYDFRQQQENLAYLIGYLSGVIYKQLGISTKIPKQQSNEEIKDGN